MKTLTVVLALVVVGLSVAVVVLSTRVREPAAEPVLDGMAPPAPVTYRLVPDDELVVLYSTGPLDEGFLSPAPEVAGDNAMDVVPLEGGSPKKAWVFIAFGGEEPQLTLGAP